MAQVRSVDEWSRHIEQIIRSRHYTWLAEGLGGEPLDEALTMVLTNIRHICEHEGLDWDELAARSRELFEAEESQAEAVCA